MLENALSSGQDPNSVSPKYERNATITESRHSLNSRSFQFDWCRMQYFAHFFFVHWLYSPLGPWPLIFQFHDHFPDCRTPWTSDLLVARPLLKHMTTQTQNKHIHISNIHALCGIRTHEPGFRASEDSAYLRSLGYRDRHILHVWSGKFRFEFVFLSLIIV
jgi:hypothetical protein